jgi:hypothetical protein
MECFDLSSRILKPLHQSYTVRKKWLDWSRKRRDKRGGREITAFVERPFVGCEMLIG